MTEKDGTIELSQSGRMNESEIKAIVEQAIGRLVKEEPELLALDVTERALSHYLARFISELVPAPLKVDVEYNRHFGKPKRLELSPRKARDREVRATSVFPDIIVHERNTDSANLLVLEVKKPGEDLDYDELKLRAFRKELGYQHAAHVILGYNQDDKLVKEVIWV